MKSLLRTTLSALIFIVLLSACTLGAQPTSDANAINTAVAGTQQSMALGQATVNANVLTAMPATPTPGPTVDYVALTEEELVALIDEAVAQAAAATEATTTVVYTSTEDDAVTSEEVTYVYEYYYTADYYVEEAEALLDEYYALYSDLAYEMMDELAAVESELNQVNETLNAVNASLQQINASIQQGIAVAEDAITQLENAAQQAQTKAENLKAQAQDTLSVLQADQQGRLDQISQIQPNNIPTDKLAALQTGFQFIDTAKAAMGDNKLSRDELTSLAQLGVNAQAGFQQFGGGNSPLAGNLDLTQFSAKFGEITTQFARGQIPQARGTIDGFERSLGTRPSGGPSLPGNGGGPGLPGRP